MQKAGDLFGSVVTDLQPAVFERKPLDLFTAEQMPLIKVLEHLDCYVKEDRDYRPRKDLSSRRYWITPPYSQKQYEIKITDKHWYNTRANKGNFGVINLVMHIFGEKYSAALSRIEGKSIENTLTVVEEHQPELLQFYTIDYLDHLPLKDDKYTMEFPFFSLKAGDMNPKLYDCNGIRVFVTPSYYGLATIDDKDLWIFAISQLIHARNQGLSINNRIRFKISDFLKSLGKPIGGKNYEIAVKALQRLKGTTIETNIKTPNYQEHGGFGLIDSWRVVEKNKNGKTVAVEIVLPNWLMCSINASTPHVLTLSPDYFKLRKPLARRLYEIARKHCGQQRIWKVSLQALHEKSGSTSSLKKFRFDVKKLLQENNLPDYKVMFNDEKDIVTFYTRDVEKLEKHERKHNK